MPLRKQICACPLDCFDVCSLEVSIDENGKVSRIEGNKNHPVTKGFTCEKGRKHLERIYDSKRLKYPMKKENNEWKRISWDTAFSLITDNLKKCMKQFGTRSIAVYNYCGSTGLLKNTEDLFFDYLGDTTRFTGSICCGAGMAAQRMDFGLAQYHSQEDMNNSRTIVVWGRNPAETNIHQYAALKDAGKRGAEIIVIDPICTETVKISNWHIKVLPGGDCALACAAAKYIIETGLSAGRFIEECTEGYDALKGYLNGLSYAALSEKCGVSVADIKSFAEQISKNTPTAFHIGFGLQRYLFGGTAIRSIDMLAAITGNIGIPGGGANYGNTIHESNMNWKAVAAGERQNRVIFRAQLGRGIRESVDPPVKLLFISRSNPLLQNPNTNEVLKGLQSIDFKVCLEHFMTDTAELCDLVLPITYFLEEEDIIISDSWNGYIHYNKPCIDRYYETKTELEIYTELAQRLNLEGFPIMKEQQWIEILLNPLLEKGLSLETLKQVGFARNPLDADIPWKDGRFATESGKMKLLGKEYLEDYFSNSDEKKEEYRLITIHSRKSLHSQHYMNNETKHPIVNISTADAKKEDFKNHEVIQLYNTYGVVEAEVCISEDYQNGILYMYEGWWLKNGGSVNRLSDDRISDIGLQAVFNECTCRIKGIGR